MPLEAEDDWLTTSEPVTEVAFIFSGGVYAEDRRCRRLPDGPREGQAFVIGHGPRLFAAPNPITEAPAWPTTLEDLEAKGLEPLSTDTRHDESWFVVGSGPSSPKPD